MLIIWTELPSLLTSLSLSAEVIRAYGVPLIMAVVMPLGSSNPVKPTWPFIKADVASGFSGSVMSIIWTALSLSAMTKAYVEEPIVIVVMPQGPLRLGKLEPSVAVAVAVGFSGSVMLIIWTPSSYRAATRAYGVPLMVTVVMS